MDTCTGRRSDDTEANPDRLIFEDEIESQRIQRSFASAESMEIDEVYRADTQTEETSGKTTKPLKEKIGSQLHW